VLGIYACCASVCTEKEKDCRWKSAVSERVERLFLFCSSKDNAICLISVMESRDLVSISRHVSRPVFLFTVSGLGFEGSRSRALSLETLHEFFSEILQEAAGLLAAIFTGTGWFWREIQITTMRQRCAWTGFWIFWTRTSAAPGRIRILVFLARTGSELDLDFVICWWTMVCETELCL